MHNIEKTIAVINELAEKGIIENYALGGATAVIFYTEPIATEDLDIFVHIRGGGNPFLEFQPIFDFLKEKGYGMKGEHFYVEGFPIQFLRTGKPLLNDAVGEANEFALQGDIIARVMTPEHLVAIMLDIGRLKDYLRISVFLEHEVLDLEKLNTLLAKYNLSRKWEENIERFQK